MLAFLVAFLAGCASLPDGRNVPDDISRYVYRNEPLPADRTAFYAGADGAAIATSDIPWRVPEACRRAFREWLSKELQPVNREDDWLARGNCDAPPKKSFVGVAVTGGGNKSAVYAAEVLFELERYGLAKHIDVLSSVSGGSFTAALYALSCDPADTACAHQAGAWHRPVWDYEEISKQLESDYFWPFIGRRFLPNHLYLNITTHHGSADDMADIVGGRLFREQGGRLRFTDLNPARPNLILNATNTTQDRAALDQDASIPPERKRPLSDDEALHFAFTQQYFWRLQSNLDTYPLADAVVASAAFPLLIDRPSLRMFRQEDLKALKSPGSPMRPPSYVSLYDGGVHDNFGLTELRWFVECQFDRNARRTAWTPEIRERYCGQRTLPRTPPAATLILGINSSLLRTEGVKPEMPKPRSWDSYLGPIRLTGAAQSVDMIMAASGELRKMELRSLVEEVSRMTAGAGARAPNPFLAPGRHQYVDIDLEASYYMSCPERVGMDGTYAHAERIGSDVPLNAANGGTERRRCEALLGVLKWNAPDGRNLELPTAPPGLCHDEDCAALDGVLRGRADAAPRPRLFAASGPLDGPRLIHNQALFNALRDVPTDFKLAPDYVRLLRYAARWAVAHRVWELCTDHPDLLDQLPGGRKPVCVDRLPERVVPDKLT